MTKLWEKPELIILVRRKSDEVILQLCKESGGGPANAYGMCLGNIAGECTPHCSL